MESILSQSAQHLEIGQARQALDTLLSAETAYSGTVEYDYLLGVVALSCEENTLALHAFERVTLKNPQHAGAWIDLAVANIRLADYQTAKSLLDYVESSFVPPASLQAQIRLIRRQLELEQKANEQAALARQHANRSWRGEFWVQAGHTSNANSGVNLNGITLTPVGSDPIYMAIDPSRKPKSDTLFQWRGVLQNLQPLSAGAETEGVGEWVLQARDKNLAKTGDYNAQDLGVAYSQDRLWGENGALRWIWGGGWQTYQLGGTHLLDSYLLHAGIKKPVNTNCSALVRVELEQRDYAQPGYADAGLQWLNGRLYCTQNQTALALGVRIAEDTPQASRAGGATLRREMTLDALHALSPQLVLEGSLVLGISEDKQGYSGLIANNRSRYNQKSNWRVALNWALEKNLTLIGSLEEYKEDSNIPLFNFAERQLLVGLRYGF